MLKLVRKAARAWRDARVSKVSLGWLPPPEPTWDAVEGRGEEKLDCWFGMTSKP